MPRLQGRRRRVRSRPRLRNLWCPMNVADLSHNLRIVTLKKLTVDLEQSRTPQSADSHGPTRRRASDSPATRQPTLSAARRARTPKLQTAAAMRVPRECSPGPTQYRRPLSTRPPRRLFCPNSIASRPSMVLSPVRVEFIVNCNPVERVDGINDAGRLSICVTRGSHFVSFGLMDSMWALRQRCMAT